MKILDYIKYEILGLNRTMFDRFGEALIARGICAREGHHHAYICIDWPNMKSHEGVGIEFAYLPDEWHNNKFKMKSFEAFLHMNIDMTYFTTKAFRVDKSMSDEQIVDGLMSLVDQIPQIELDYKHEQELRAPWQGWTLKNVSKDGGPWLAASRKWIQNNIVGGDRIKWGSETIIPLTMKQIEELTSHAVAAERNERATPRFP